MQHFICQPSHTEWDKIEEMSSFHSAKRGFRHFFLKSAQSGVFVPLSVCVDTTPSAHRSRPSWRQWPKHPPGSSFPICFSLAPVHCVIMHSSIITQCTFMHSQVWVKVSSVRETSVLFEASSLKLEEPSHMMEKKHNCKNVLQCVWKHIYVLT